ncbi:hypothetical protein, partial [Victivallis vadensis]|uniref:hypothetical protein n=1 Tax=Victivallis vadensis TaxID=172901 RepID=UPI00266B98D5
TAGNLVRFRPAGRRQPGFRVQCLKRYIRPCTPAYGTSRKDQSYCEHNIMTVSCLIFYHEKRSYYLGYCAGIIHNKDRRKISDVSDGNMTAL